MTQSDISAKISLLCMFQKWDYKKNIYPSSVHYLKKSICRVPRKNSFSSFCTFCFGRCMGNIYMCAQRDENEKACLKNMYTKQRVYKLLHKPNSKLILVGERERDQTKRLKKIREPCMQKHEEDRQQVEQSSLKQ